MPKKTKPTFPTTIYVAFDETFECLIAEPDIDDFDNGASVATYVLTDVRAKIVDHSLGPQVQSKAARTSSKSK